MRCIVDHVAGRLSIDLCPDAIEQRIIRGYVRLLFMPQLAGRRRTTLGWIGRREVRLTEVEPSKAQPGAPRFWVEIHCHDRNVTIDSCGCFEFDEDELSDAVGLVMEAGRHHQDLNGYASH
jgi:hypothetical protein